MHFCARGAGATLQPDAGPTHGADAARQSRSAPPSAGVAAFELVLALGLLGLVLLLTYLVGLPLASLLEARGVRPLAEAAGRWLAGYPDWVRGLLVDGAIRGAGTVLTLVPMLGVLLATAAVVEQTGGVSRMTVAAQRITGRLGVSGALVVPLCFGFACNVPAIVALRGVPFPRERLAAMLLAPFVPCSARLAVVALLTPMFFARAAPLVAWGLVSINLIVFVFGGWCLLGRASRRADVTACVAAPRRLRCPQLRVTMVSLGQSLGSFIRSAGPIVLALSAVAGLLASIPGGGVERSVLAQFGRSLEPAARVAGLDDWRLIVALLSSAVTKETGLAVLSVLFGASTDGNGLREALTATVSPASALAYLAIQMLFVPCVPTLWAMAREAGSWRWPLASAAAMLTVSLVAGTVVYQVGRLL